MVAFNLKLQTLPEVERIDRLLVIELGVHLVVDLLKDLRTILEEEHLALVLRGEQDP
jgi:hypothetical protein